MIEIGVFEAKNRLSALIADVKNGAEVTITSHGKPVARLMPVVPDEASRKAAARAAIARLRDRGHAAGISAGWAEWQSYRDEGRR